MEVVIEITLKDLLFYSRYINENSPSFRRDRAIIKYIFRVIAIGLVGASFISIGLVQIQLTVFCLLLSVPLFFYEKISDYDNNEKSSRFYEIANKTTDKGIIGVHAITINDDGVLVENSFKIYLLKWDSIEKVVKTEKYIFVHTSLLSALTIPQNSFPNGSSYEGFYDFIMTKILVEDIT
jgi:hypothetical protein